VLDVVRGHGLRCVANISGEPVDLGRRTTVLLSSASLSEICATRHRSARAG